MRFPIHTLVLTGLLVLLPAAVVPPAFAQWEGCAASAWDGGEIYLRGYRVSHDYHEWKAKRASEGVVPGTHKPTWQDLGACASEPPPPPPPPPLDPSDREPLQIFGVWHAGNHYADWALPRELPEFDEANRWIIAGNYGKPSVNLVVLSFLQPMQVLEMDPEDPTTGVPIGMTQEVVDYFKNEGIRVMMSIGGVTYTEYWDEALATDATQLGLNAAAIATEYGVGIEIDYERNVGANLVGLQAFVDAYRSMHPYDEAGANPAARLTIDLAAGGRYLQELNRYATINWLDDLDPVLDYANAMVHRSSGTPDNWQEHIDGKPQYDPPIPPKAPKRFTGGLYLKGNMANCLDFYSSEQWQHAEYVQTVAPNGAGSSNGMLGYMFWAAEYPSARKNYVGTVPPDNTCENGMGTAMDVFEVEVQMPALRQD
jgi:RimJ/RimL family protein N-acetyltransferase